MSESHFEPQFVPVNLAVILNFMFLNTNLNYLESSDIGFLVDLRLLIESVRFCGHLLEQPLGLRSPQESNLNI